MLKLLVLQSLWDCLTCPEFRRQEWWPGVKHFRISEANEGLGDDAAFGRILSGITYYNNRYTLEIYSLIMALWNSSSDDRSCMF